MVSIGRNCVGSRSTLPDYTPHTSEEIASMLEFLELGSLDDLFSTIPQAIRVAGGLKLSPGIPEPDVRDRLAMLARSNRVYAEELICFAGGGAYDHEIPPVVKALAGRSEFVTSYTPYQPEVAQGVLQALFEFQTMVSRLFGLPVANASLYDGASALVESVNMSTAGSSRQTVWISSGVHPHWRRVLSTLTKGRGLRVRTVALQDGTTIWPHVNGLSEDCMPDALVVSYPNYLGCIEELDRVRKLCDQLGATMIVAVDPVSAGLLRRAGDWGADIAIGEGQVFGNPMGFGGPYLGMLACSLKYVRRLPGRLVGETTDSDGTRAYVTTLRAREQDIRRESATSNVCTNQTLMAVTAAIQLSWLGRQGLRELALRCARGTRYLRDQLLGIDGVEATTKDTPVLREFSLRTRVPALTVIDRMAESGFLAGLALGDLVGGTNDESMTAEDVEKAILISVTERRRRDEIDAYVGAFEKACQP